LQEDLCKQKKFDPPVQMLLDISGIDRKMARGLSVAMKANRLSAEFSVL
jgi:hypothetical protein